MRRGVSLLGNMVAAHGKGNNTAQAARAGIISRVVVGSVISIMSVNMASRLQSRDARCEELDEAITEFCNTCAQHTSVDDLTRLS